MNKIRITLYDKGNSICSDRLVDSAVEFRNGPTTKHTEGDIRIDFKISNREEAESLVGYISKLALDLPIPEKTTKIPKTKEALEKNTLDQLIADCKKAKYQEDLIDYLRSLNFVMLTQDHWKDIVATNNFNAFVNKKKIDKVANTKKILHLDYQVMARQLRLAKDPKNDKFDQAIVFLFKFIGHRVERVHIYEGGRFKETLELPWKDHGEINFKVKEKFYKFPEIMTYEERSKWRLEDRKVQFKEGYTPSQFYTKYLPFITILQPLKK